MLGFTVRRSFPCLILFASLLLGGNVVAGFPSGSHSCPLPLPSPASDNLRLHHRVLTPAENAGLTPQLKRRYTYGHDLISQTQLPSTLNTEPSTSYYGYDGHGSVRMLLSSASGASTQITDTYDYDAYGQLLATDGTTVNLYRYTGEQWDNDLGMYYLRARYLNPNTGRFWTMDSYEGNTQDPLTLHKYLYCHADPLNRIDPSGHLSTIEVSVATTIAIKIDITAIAAVLYLAHRADIALTEATGKRAIQDFVATHQDGFTKEDFEGLERTVASRTSAGRKRELFLHYNRQRYAGSLLATGLRSPAWTTKDVYETGWKAKYYLAAYTGEPRDAAYIVWPRSNVLYYGPNTVRGRLDQWSGIWLAGGGSEYYFPNGSGGALTVFGPIPIPVGQPPPF